MTPNNVIKPKVKLMKKQKTLQIFFAILILLSYGCATDNISKTKTIAPVNKTLATQELKQLIATNNRAGIATWSEKLSVAELNRAVAALSSDSRRQLTETIVSTPAKDKRKKQLINAANAVLDNQLLGFYIELFAHTEIKVHEAKGGGYASGDHISISTGLMDSDDPKALRNTLTHELFHIFNHREHASTGISGLNEGTAIWIFKTAFTDLADDQIALGLAEPTFGTMNFYRDIKLKGYPTCIPLGIPNASITQKGREVYRDILMKRDPSKLPIFDTGKMQRIYDKYYRDLNRNQDFAIWLKLFETQHKRMVEELNTTGDCVLPVGFTNVINKCPTPPAN